MHTNSILGNLEKTLPVPVAAFLKKIPILCTPIAPTEGETIVVLATWLNYEQREHVCKRNHLNTA